VSRGKKKKSSSLLSSPPLSSPLSPLSNSLTYGTFVCLVSRGRRRGEKKQEGRRKEKRGEEGGRHTPLTDM
jgi:hypothetical protein